MAYNTLALGLTLTIPANGTKNWGTTLYNTTWTKISNHSHTGGGDGNKISTAALLNNCVTSAKLAHRLTIQNLALTVGTELVPVGTTQTIDFDTGSIQRLNVGSASGDVGVTLTNPQDGGVYVIYIKQGATPRDVTWPVSVKWPQGQKPILSTVSGKVDVVQLMYVESEYRGMWELDFS